MVWKKGQSGNPQGRPKKTRALTEILARAGSKTIEDADGKRRSGKRIVARLLWQAATTGVVRFPDTKETVAISLSDWLGIVRFLYGHIDGPPKQALDLTTAGEPLTIPQHFEIALTRAYDSIRPISGNGGEGELPERPD